MATPNPVVVVIREWLLDADNDLKAAVHTLTLGVDCPRAAFECPSLRAAIL